MLPVGDVVSVLPLPNQPGADSVAGCLLSLTCSDQTGSRDSGDFREVACVCSCPHSVPQADSSFGPMLDLRAL